MAKPLSPVGGWGGTFGGIDVLESDGFDLHCFAARTGTKFFAVSEPRAPGVDALLRRYETATHGRSLVVVVAVVVVVFILFKRSM